MDNTLSTIAHSRNPRTLILSLRNIFKNDLFRCPLYEFEDVIAEIDHAEIVAPHGDPTSRRNLLAKRLAFHAPITLKADVEKPQVNKHYDLFFSVCGSPRDLLMIDALSYLRDACTTKVCLVDELWVKQMDDHRYFLNVLKGFDLVALYYSQSVKTLGERLGCKTVFVPPGIDSLRFCPYPANRERVVDVYSVGRRSQVTHDSILKMVEDQGILYLHDSIEGTEAINPREHRALFANVAKRSKYFIVNPGLIDRPDRRGNQIEIGNRYFEGAASGMIMIGEIPNNGEFERLFDWPDAVTHLSYGSDKIGELMGEWEAQPEKQERIRRMNVSQALTRHDWAYRWESILRNAGLELMPELSHRKERLANMAESVNRLDTFVANGQTHGVRSLAR
jgi:Glycosyl transferases group 1